MKSPARPAVPGARMVAEPAAFWAATDLNPMNRQQNTVFLSTWRIIPGLVAVVDNHGDRKSHNCACGNPF